ncbi:MAG: oligopeptide:H+ symporter [Steroidobacteraceae bacterium]
MSPGPEATDLPSRTFFGHPIGLANLFFTEMWERFSYYGMRALLVLFLVDAVNHGGFGLDDRTATAIYGLYTASVYLFALGGGWLADRVMGGQRAVLIGGVIIACGHLLLGFAGEARVFYLGLVVIVAGTALLKPNVSAMVAQLYPEGGARSDAGFTLYYMGINLGAMIGPLVTGWLAQRYGWHWGFGAAAAGMILGVLQFAATRHQLGVAGREPHGLPNGADPRRILGWLLGLAALVALLVGLAWSGALRLDPIAVQAGSTQIIVVAALLYFAYLLTGAGLTSLEKKRVWLLLVLFLGCALFWSGFEQAGSSFNLFAERYTRLQYGALHIPAAWFQSVNSVFLVLLAPVMTALWMSLGARRLDPSAPVKFALGLAGMAGGFIVLAGAAHFVAAGQQVGPQWLILTYLLHTIGELALSPIGMSACAQLVPQRFVGQVLGLWFLGMSLGNLIASRLAGNFDPANTAAMPGQFMNIFWFGMVSAVALLIASHFIQRWIRNSER